MKNSKLDCRIINLPVISSSEGNLTYIENSVHIPFNIKRIYYLYDIPGGSERGSHAHKNLHQIFIAMSGSFDIHIDDGENKKTFHLNRSFTSLYVPPMKWRLLNNFSSGSVCMVLASDTYHENDYIRNYHDFINNLS